MRAALKLVQPTAPRPTRGNARKIFHVIEVMGGPVTTTDIVTLADDITVSAERSRESTVKTVLNGMLTAGYIERVPRRGGKAYQIASFDHYRECQEKRPKEGRRTVDAPPINIPPAFWWLLAAVGAVSGAVGSLVVWVVL